MISPKYSPSDEKGAVSGASKCLNYLVELVGLEPTAS